MNKQLRIVVPRYGPSIIGGSEALAGQLARQLVGRGWRIDVWTTTATEEASWSGDLPEGGRVEEGVAVRRFAIRMRRHPEAFAQFSRGFWRLPPRTRPERAWLLGQGPYSPGLVRALATDPGAPTLFIPRILIPAAHDEPPLRLRVVQRAIAAADSLWFSTIEERELLVGVHPEVAGHPYAVGTVAVDPPEHIDGARFRTPRGLVDVGYFLYGGRIAAGKGFDTLLDGFRRARQRYPQLRLVLSGDASAAGGTEPGTVGVGTLIREDLWDAIAGAIAVVVHSHLESLSLLALEAWAAGRPALLNARSPVLAGQAERSGGALTFTDADSLGDAMIRLVADPAHTTELGLRGRNYVADHYRWDGVVERLGDLIAHGRRR